MTFCKYPTPTAISYRVTLPLHYYHHLFLYGHSLSPNSSSLHQPLSLNDCFCLSINSTSLKLLQVDHLPHLFFTSPISTVHLVGSLPITTDLSSLTLYQLTCASSLLHNLTTFQLKWSSACVINTECAITTCTRQLSSLTPPS